jgi:hypothetical protein
VLDGDYRRGTGGEPIFVEAAAPTDEALQVVLRESITRILNLLTRRGVPVEEQGSPNVADNDVDPDDNRTFTPLQAPPADTTDDEFGSP